MEVFVTVVIYTLLDDGVSWQPRFEVVLGRTVSVTSSVSAVLKSLHVGRANGYSADQSPRETDVNDAGGEIRHGRTSWPAQARPKPD